MKPVTYRIELTEQAEAGLLSLEKTDQSMALKQLEKLKRAPALGEPLGSKLAQNLTGLRRLAFAKMRLRIVYEINQAESLVTVWAIGPRERMKVYEVADSEVKQRRLRRIQ